ncbi:hypothetical protein C8J56DRAFT_340132 [Mycena floridula]|nr:hypothetical protein C8J56DRAFT_340132 [Mycena floridula]
MSSSAVSPEVPTVDPAVAPAAEPASPDVVPERPLVSSPANRVTLGDFAKAMTKSCTAVRRIHYNRLNEHQTCDACTTRKVACIVQNNRLRCDDCIERHVKCSRITIELEERVMEELSLTKDAFKEMLALYQASEALRRPSARVSKSLDADSTSCNQTPTPRRQRVRTKLNASQIIRQLREKITAAKSQLEELDEVLDEVVEDRHALQERYDELHAAEEADMQARLIEVSQDVALVHKVNQARIDFETNKISDERAVRRVLRLLRKHLDRRQEECPAFDFGVIMSLPAKEETESEGDEEHGPPAKKQRIRA